MNGKPELHDCAPTQDDFFAEVTTGLRNVPRQVPCKYFYDERGSHLFDSICELDEYYPTRTEVAIMCQNRVEIAERLGPACALIEYGSGSSKKTRILLDSRPDLAAYVPIDISREHLLNSAAALKEEYPGLPILPVCADYTQEFSLPLHSPAFARSARQVVYFPGSTIGNFTPEDALAFLAHVGEVCGENGGLLIGVDLHKDSRVLHSAYNDSYGVTAQFNLNLLQRINTELDGDFPLDSWRHHAFYNEDLHRIEMHLCCQEDHAVTIGGESFTFSNGETICTEYSHKYTLEGFATLAAQAGFTVQQVWTDERRWFSVQYLTR